MPASEQPAAPPVADFQGGRAHRTRRAQLLPRVGLAAINLAWAAGYPLTALALRDMSASFLTVVRMGISALICLPLLRRLPPGAAWSRRTLWLALGLGVGGFAVPVYLQTVGLALSTPAVTAILVSTEPLFTALIATALLKERLPWTRGLALAVALGGAWTIAGAPRPGHSGHLWGEAILLASTVCFAAYNAISSRLTATVGAPAATGAVLVAAWAGSLPLWALTGATLPTALHLVAALSAGYLAVVCTGAAYIVWMYAVDRLPVAQVAIFLYLQPVFGAALSFWLAGRGPDAGFYLGAALVLGGVVLGEWGPTKERLAPVATAPPGAA